MSTKKSNLAGEEDCIAIGALGHWIKQAVAEIKFRSQTLQVGIGEE